MEISNKEINLGLIVRKYEEELAKSDKAISQKVLLTSSVNDLLSITKVAKNTANSSSKKKKIEIDESLDLDFDTGDLTGYLEKCFGCSLRIKGDFQLSLDLDIGAALKDLLESIKAQLELVKKSFDTTKDLEQICAALNLFNGIPCPQDIVSIILSLKILLKKYTASTFKLKLDWFTLFGPLISAIAQALGTATSSLFDVIEAPLNCNLALMQSNLSLLRTIDPLQFATDVVPNDKTSSVDVTLTDINTLSNQTLSLDQIKAFINTNKDLVVPSAISATGTLGDMLKDPNKTNLFDLSLPEKIILAIGEAKSYVEDFKKKILGLINNIKGLVHTGKFFEIQSIMAAIYLAELIGFILKIVKYLGAGTFEALCKDNPQAVDELIKTIDPNYTANVEKIDNTYSVSLSSSNTSKKIYISSCSKSTTDTSLISNMLNNIEKVLNG